MLQKTFSKNKAPGYMSKGQSTLVITIDLNFIYLLIIPNKKRFWTKRKTVGMKGVVSKGEKTEGYINSLRAIHGSSSN